MVNPGAVIGKGYDDLLSCIVFMDSMLSEETESMRTIAGHLRGWLNHQVPKDALTLNQQPVFNELNYKIVAAKGRYFRVLNESPSPHSNSFVCSPSSE
jgi:hypothetical protein